MEDVRRIEVVKVKPLKTLKNECLSIIARNPTTLSGGIPETEEEVIEIKKEIVSDEERDDTNEYALERYTERLTKINSIPSAYDYCERTKRKITTIQSDKEVTKEKIKRNTVSRGRRNNERTTIVDGIRIRVTLSKKLNGKTYQRERTKKTAAGRMGIANAPWMRMESASDHESVAPREPNE